MILDKTNFKVGTVFYGVEETTNAWLRKKIHKVIDGENWFKYSEPNRSYYLKEYVILGIMQKSLEGLWDINEFFPLENEYYVHVTTPTGGSSYVTPLDLDDGVKFFMYKDEALEYIRTLEEKALELEK